MPIASLINLSQINAADISPTTTRPCTALSCTSWTQILRNGLSIYSFAYPSQANWTGPPATRYLHGRLKRPPGWILVSTSLTPALHHAPPPAHGLDPHVRGCQGV